MKPNYMVYCLLMLFIISCSSSKKAFYSSDHLNREEIQELFLTKPMIITDDLNNVAECISSINPAKKISKSELKRSLRCRILVNSAGGLCGVIIENPENRFIDSLIISSLKKLKFKIMRDEKERAYGYSFKMKYVLRDGYLIPQAVKENPVRYLTGNNRVLFDSTLNNLSFGEEKGVQDSTQYFELSRWDWNWEPYFMEFKKRLMKVWELPEEYSRYGRTHGYTLISFTIKRNGKLDKMKLLGEEGDLSLRIASEQAILAAFPLEPIPEDYPDSTLKVTLKMIYPELRNIFGN